MLQPQPVAHQLGSSHLNRNTLVVDPVQTDHYVDGEVRAVEPGRKTMVLVDHPAEHLFQKK